MRNREDYIPVIGLEIHVQLATKSKIFSGDSAGFGAAANENISAISLGYPGTLPKMNKRALTMAVKMGLACHCDIAETMIFDRKNYFYPDLPKGYQITQDRTPVCKNGFVSIEVDGIKKEVKLFKIHLEEDAGKSMHEPGEGFSLIDFNRAGVPLIEIVTDPVLSSSKEASAMMSEVRKLVRYLDISDGNMEEGSLRCDANISVMPKGATQLGVKVEVKNMNSIKNVQRAIDFEIERQIDLINKGETIVQETRTFNAGDGSTSSMREKETLTDYRYFPDPDLIPIEITKEQLKEINNSMPRLPWEVKEELIKNYGLPEYDAEVLSEDRLLADYYKEASENAINNKAISNWMMGPVKSVLNEKNISIKDFALKPMKLTEIANFVDEGKVSFSIAVKSIFPELEKNPDQSVEELAKKLNVLLENNEDEMISMINEVLNANPKEAAELKKGKKKLMGMFMGEIMKKSKGKADPKIIKELLEKEISSL
ncbi:MAG: Asp-tRNA(Asn)/Glu-tRNA(Gln) amidotransferase subunit GatB [Cyclobacteriaceae bacterium]|nr:Asp-tRNA(Asn)/Glu-tRNA(Gln) amidotransferase subunit GatB [Cyclobacteriaceae bacterium]